MFTLLPFNEFDQDRANAFFTAFCQWSIAKHILKTHGDISQSGRYCHEFTMTVTAERDHPFHPAMTDDAEDVLTEAFRDLARWLYARLCAEYEYLTSDEAVDEAIVANDYTFTEAGERFG